MTTFKVFKAWMTFEATSAALSTDSDWDDRPTRSVGPGHDATVTGYGLTSPSHIRRGVINQVSFRLNPANAVTYRLTLFDDITGADQTYQLRARKIFDSTELVAAGADDIEYNASDLQRPFALEDVGDFFYNIDWSAASGDVTGYVIIRGVYEALDN